MQHIRFSETISPKPYPVAQTPPKTTKYLGSEKRRRYERERDRSRLILVRLVTRTLLIPRSLHSCVPVAVVWQLVMQEASSRTTTKESVKDVTVSCITDLPPMAFSHKNFDVIRGEALFRCVTPRSAVNEPGCSIA